MESPELETPPTLQESPTTQEEQAHTAEAEALPLKPREIAMNEYLELCNSIKNGRVLESPEPPKKTKNAKGSSKTASKIATTEPEGESEVPKPKRTRRKAEPTPEPISDAPSTEPLPTNDLPPLPTVPTKARRRSSSLASASTSQQEPKAEELAPASTFPEPDLSKLPEKWQHAFEKDWSSARASIESMLSKYDAELRESKDFVPFAPLASTNLQFWNAPFEWDADVSACATKYVQSALISKAVLDPSSAPKSTSSTYLPPSFTFKPLQREAINMALAGCDTLLALATGGGKTMCYVLPALLAPGITIVISPLISLIQDQVTLLDSMGVSAAGLSGQMAHEELEALYDQLLVDRCPFKVVYATPERIARNARFLNTLIELNRRGKLQRVVIDEAHCISEWGHDFRKDYRRLSLLKERLPDVPIMAVTGTCTPTVRQDIAEQLGLAFSNTTRTPTAYRHAPPSLQIAESARVSQTRSLSRYYVLQTSFNRPNLWFQVAQKSPETPMADMLYYILNHGLANECGIIFTMTTNDAERLAEFFAEQGLQTSFYHGGMSPQARQASHAKWARGEAKLMCTTVAFGMGIDKSNVRYVLHSTMPTSLEAYYQQAGRAGRDGQPADCVLFFQYRDRIKLEHVIKLHAHLAQQRQRVSEIVKLREIAETKLLAEIRKSTQKKSRSKAAKNAKVASSGLDSDSASQDRGNETILKADDFDSEGFDSTMNIVDIVDIPDGDSGIVRLLRADGAELLFNGFHPDYNSDVSEVVQLEDDPIDAFVRQIKTEKLDDVTSFCREKTACRRLHLMRFFGESFSKQQCDHNCDICNPTALRVTSKLNRKGKAQWESLKGAREERKIAKLSKPLVPIVAKLHAAIQIQEEEFTRESNAAARQSDEAEYERQVSRKGRPAIPTRIGQSSPLARKQRKSRFSTLGDPANYDLIQEQLEDIDKKPRRKSSPLKTKSEAHASENKIDALEIGSHSEKSERLSPIRALIEDSRSSTPTHSDTVPSQEEESLIVPQGLDKLMDSISRVAEAKALRRSASKNKRLSSMRMSVKRSEAPEEPIEDEDGYVRTHPNSYASTLLMDGDNFIPQLNRSPLPSNPITEPVVTTGALHYDLEDELAELSSKATRTTSESLDEVRSSAFDSQRLAQVREACKVIAEERHTSAKNVMSQKVMKDLVEASPQTVLQLAAVKGIGPRRAQWFSNILLPIFKNN